MSKLDCTWEGDAKDKGERTIFNVRLLARYRGYLEKARRSGNVQLIVLWETRITNLLKNS